MSKATHKETAKKILKDVAKNPESYKPKTKTTFIGIEANKKGGFYSAVFEMELSVKHELGEISFTKNVQLPLNLLGDVLVPEEEKEEAAEGAAE